MDEKIVERVEEIRERITQHKLVISRVPKNTLDRFKQLCSQDEFCEDYGLCLKFLVDFYFGLIPTGLEALEAKLDMLNGRVAVLENKQQETVVRRMMNGKVIEKKEA